MTDKNTELAIVSKTELLEGEKRFVEAIKKYKARVSKLTSDILSYYWDIGKDLNTVAEKPGYFGSNTVANFAQALNLSGETIRAGMRFNKVYDKEHLKNLQARQISWHNAVALLSVDSVDKRTELEKQLAQGDVKAADLSSIISEITEAERKAGKKTRRGGGKIPASVIRRGASQVEAVSKFLGGDVLQALKEFAKMADDKKSKCLEHEKTLKANLKMLIKKIEALHSYLD